eukprot:g5389.t1
MRKTIYVCVAAILLATTTIISSVAATESEAKETTVTLEDFQQPVHSYRETNDPVMGGQSTGTLMMSDGLAVFNGSVVDVPSLKAPGFIKFQTADGLFSSKSYPDVSACTSLTITAKASNDYKGFRVSFGNAHPSGGKFFAFGYKANFAPSVGEFGTTTIDFTNFTDLWDDGTGNAIKTCKDDAQYCPDKKTLKNMKTLSIWAEGVAGDVHLEIKSIGASGCVASPVLRDAAPSSTIVIDSFDSPKHTYKQKNDPVMGGRSTGTFSIQGGVGVFNGSVVDVPFLHAPGFITVQTTDSLAFADVSTCDALTITAKASSDYKGYRVSFGTAHPSGGKYHAYGYKANFAPSVGEFGQVTIPFDMFTDLWDDATGDAIKTCKEDAQYCPDKKTLESMETLSIWAEGIAGDVHLEIKSIGASGCDDASLLARTKTLVFTTTSSPPPPSFNNSCSGPIQSNLLYNMSNTQAYEDFPFPLGPSEDLASAVCCDAAFQAYAEPRNTYARPDVNLFANMNRNGTTTFYDPVCGIPLFTVPQGRSFQDFVDDTTEHGWPSFRKEELVEGNSRVDKDTGLVFSKCNTHLGSFLPDEKGDRWCLDIACVSGRRA